MRPFVFTCLAVLWVGTAGGQPPKSPALAPAPPTTVKAKSGTLAVVKANSAGEVVFVFDRRYLPEAQTYHDKAAKALVITSGTAATYYVSAVEFQTGKGFVQTDYLVTFEGGPVPPTPPGPDPPPPPDTLAKRVADAYAADKAAGKAKADEFRLVGTVFGRASDFLSLPTTTGEVLKLLRATLDAAVTDGDLPNVKKVVAARLAAVSKSDVPLTDALRGQFKTAFTELAQAIAGVQP